MLFRSRRVRSASRVVAASSRTRLAVESLEDRLAPATFTVTNTYDGGSGSLRWAITRANATPGADLIDFDLPGTGVHTIAPTSALPAITDRVAIAGNTQWGFAGTPVIELNGGGAGNDVDGLVINPDGSGSVIRGLVINRFDHAGLRILGSNCRVVGNYIGTDSAGASWAGNVVGVLISPGASNNVIGGTTAGARNIISGNFLGVIFRSASGNVVQGNFIGVDRTGAVPLGNGQSGVYILQGSRGNVIGGTAAGAGNVISGNGGSGVQVYGAGTTGNRVEGNFIGTDADGFLDIGNRYTGVRVYRLASDNVIGGEVTGAGNIISGNGRHGVVFVGAGTTGNRLQGNFIGTDASGTNPNGNTLSGFHMSGASGNLVGGTTAAALNVISGNGTGVQLTRNASGNRVLGNYIGTDFTGAAALGNSGSGVLLTEGASDNLIGGVTAGARNVISGNLGNGVEITVTGTTGNRIQRNRIGLAATGGAAIANGLDGIHINGGARGNVVGGTRPGTGNVIAHNGGSGVAVVSGARNAILGNRIFDNGALGIDLGNDGVTLNDLNDVDTGANRLLNFPELSLGVRDMYRPGLFIGGSIFTEAGKTLRIEFFSSPTIDPSGYGEGKWYLGFITVQMGNANGVTFNTFLPAWDWNGGEGDWITATVTDELGNTSEFSAASRWVWL